MHFSNMPLYSTLYMYMITYVTAVCLKKLVFYEHKWFYSSFRVTEDRIALKFAVFLQALRWLNGHYLFAELFYDVNP